MSLPYKGELIPRARELRKDMTSQERKLWYLFLSKHPVRFQRQKAIGSFVVDFYCAKVRLVIEIDGMQHHSGQGEAYDLERTALLSKQNIEIIRFDNSQIELQFNDVCQAIDAKVKEKIDKSE